MDNEDKPAQPEVFESHQPKQSELSALLCAIRGVGELNNFKQANIQIFDTGAVYLFDDKELISRWNTPQEFIASCT